MIKKTKKQLEQIYSNLIVYGKRRNEVLRSMTIDKIQYLAECIDGKTDTCNQLIALINACIFCVSFAVIKNCHVLAIGLIISLNILRIALNKRIRWRVALFLTGRCVIEEAEDHVTVKYADKELFNTLKLQKEGN